MSDSLFNPSELKFLWKRRGDKNYELKSFISNGTFIQHMEFEDLRNRQKILGKIITSPREGEAYHWPRLQHENLAPLLDIVSINEKISVYLLPLYGNSLKNVIHVSEFMNDSECFNRKRAYTEDILWALDYLHDKSLCLLNLTELNISICSISDKAVICDFSHLFLTERAMREKLELPVLYQAPECRAEFYDPISVETWACGVMLLQIFTKHYLPLAFVGEEVHRVLQAVQEMNYDTVKEANPGAQLDFSVVEELREFLGLFLVKDPKKRSNVRSAATSPFLSDSRRLVKHHDGKDSYFKLPNQASKINSLAKNRGDSATFKDIYLEEVANCRAKFKKLPSTNKFINLDLVPHGDNIAKNNEDMKNKKSSSKNKLDGNLKNVVKCESIHSSELYSPKNSKKSTRNNDETTLLEYSDNSRNDLSLDFVNSANSLKSREMSNSRNTEKSIINEEDNDSFDIQSTDYWLKPSIKSTIGHHETLDSKSQFSSESDISTNSTQSFESTDSKDHLAEQNEAIVSDLTLNDGIYDFNNDNRPDKDTREYLLPEKGSTYSTNIIRSKSEIIQNSSNSWENFSQNALNTAYFRQSDPDINYLKVSKKCAVNFYLGASISFWTSYKEKSSKRIIDSTEPNKNLSEVTYCNYKKKNYGVKAQQNIKQSTEGVICNIKHQNYPESVIRNYDTGNKVQYLSPTDEMSRRKQVPMQDVKSQFSVEKQFKESDLFKIDKNIEGNKTKLSEVQITPKFMRNNSYEQAISQGLTTIAEHETTKNLSKVKKFKAIRLKSPKISFGNTKTLNTVERDKETNSKRKILKREEILPIRDILLDEENMQPLQHSRIDPIENYLIKNKSNTSLKTKKGKKKRKWIYYLCPGSRWN